jgi:hypothetical protein
MRDRYVLLEVGEVPDDMSTVDLIASAAALVNLDGGDDGRFAVEHAHSAVHASLVAPYRRLTPVQAMHPVERWQIQRRPA